MAITSKPPEAPLIIWHPAATAPAKHVKANGAAMSRTAYAWLFGKIGTSYGAGDGATTFNIPDLRAEFLRGLDDGRGVDTGRALGSAQADAFQGHRHSLGYTSGGSVPVSGGSQAAGNTGDPITNGTNGTPRTASETRPRNVSGLYCIRVAP